jgi:hypothetical protein
LRILAYLTRIAAIIVPIAMCILLIGTHGDTTIVHQPLDQVITGSIK